MNNVICAIAKNENTYINDWVNYHLHMGFDRIYIYDNNDFDSPFVGDFIDKKDKVEIIDVRGKHEPSFQNKCYNDFYNNNKFDWCAFIDIDEFIVLNKWNTISNFLNDPIFSNTNVIRLNWCLYGDDDLVERDMTKPVYEVFTKKVATHFYNKHGKEIIRGGLSNIDIVSSHYCFIDGVLPKQIMPDGKETLGTVNVGRECSEAWISHYMTKTISEFVNQKLNRSDAQFIDRYLSLNYFWNVNTKTPQKLEWLDKNLNNV